MSETVDSCKICSEPYEVYSMMVGDQSVCSSCRMKARENAPGFRATDPRDRERVLNQRLDEQEEINANLKVQRDTFEQRVIKLEAELDEARLERRRCAEAYGGAQHLLLDARNQLEALVKKLTL